MTTMTSNVSPSSLSCPFPYQIVSLDETLLYSYYIDISIPTSNHIASFVCLPLYFQPHIALPKAHPNTPENVTPLHHLLSP
jgi:hypothetical protein